MHSKAKTHRATMTRKPFPHFTSRWCVLPVWARVSIGQRCGQAWMSCNDFYNKREISINRPQFIIVKWPIFINTVIPNFIWLIQRLNWSEIYRKLLKCCKRRWLSAFISGSPRKGMYIWRFTFYWRIKDVRFQIYLY